VPFTWKLEVPVAAPPVTDTVRVLLAGGVTEAGLKLQLTPPGWLAQERPTALLKPFEGVTVQVVVPLAP
jgi:hypothetical protein